jgi:hypothetical protein
MRTRSFLGVCIIASLHTMPALAVDMTAEEIQRMVDEAVTKKLQEHERRETGGERALEEKAGQPAAQSASAQPVRENWCTRSRFYRCHGRLSADTRTSNSMP